MGSLKGIKHSAAGTENITYILYILIPCENLASTLFIQGTLSVHLV